MQQTIWFQFRTTKEDRSQMKAEAAVLDLTLAEYVRELRAEGFDRLKAKKEKK